MKFTSSKNHSILRILQTQFLDHFFTHLEILRFARCRNGHFGYKANKVRNLVVRDLTMTEFTNRFFSEIFAFTKYYPRRKLVLQIFCLVLRTPVLLQCQDA